MKHKQGRLNSQRAEQVGMGGKKLRGAGTGSSAPMPSVAPRDLTKGAGAGRPAGGGRCVQMVGSPKAPIVRILRPNGMVGGIDGGMQPVKRGKP